MDYDVVLIGGGPAGYPAAIRASQLGLKAAIIEKEEVGGVCLNWGCIPTKALLHVAKKYDFIKNHAHQMGIKCDKTDFDFKEVVAYSRSVVKKLTSGIGYLLHKNKVELFKDQAQFTKGGKIKLLKSGKEINAKNTIIATGARPRPLQNLQFDHKLVWDYKDAMVPKKLPKSILIVGSGAIGMEFACVYNAFGCDVTVVEMQKDILQTEDKEIRKIAHKVFTDKGIKIITECQISSAKKLESSVDVKLSNGKSLNIDRILVAIGVLPNSENLNIESLQGLKTEKGFIQTDQFCSAGAKNVYAIGDVTSHPCLAHKATHQGILCINKIAGKSCHKIIKTDIPSCIYSLPQIASIGLTEDAAISAGYKIKVGRAKPTGNGKSVAAMQKEGLVKTIFDKDTGELLGAHMIGEEVTEMLQGFIIAKNAEATDECLKNVIFPHPTMSEMMHEAILAADGQEIHS